MWQRGPQAVSWPGNAGRAGAGDTEKFWEK